MLNALVYVLLSINVSIRLANLGNRDKIIMPETGVSH